MSGTVPTQTCEQKEVPKTETPKQEEPVVVKDSDNDGVLDDKDKCANTPAGTLVDSDGCPKVTVTIDTDGDGVADTSDLCPGTTAGTTVDQNGCPVVTPPGPTGLLLPGRRQT